MDVHLMGVMCVEAFRIFNLVFGKKSLYPTVGGDKGAEHVLRAAGSLRCLYDDPIHLYYNLKIFTQSLEN
jgi:hypothetical protein